MISQYTIETESFTVKTCASHIAIALAIIHAPATLIFPKGKLRIHDKDTISILELTSGNSIELRHLTKYFAFLSNPTN